jgi:glycosyltransferase involved in cell wall biosynthesis
VTADDVAAWSRAMLSLLQDDTKRHAYGVANRRNALQFDWNIIAKQYADLYFSVGKSTT